MSHDLVRGSTPPDMTGAMQIFVYGLPRIPLPRTPVNKGKKPRSRDPLEPRPATQIVDAHGLGRWRVHEREENGRRGFGARRDGRSDGAGGHGGLR